MGTATTMNSLAEVLGMSLPGSAAIPAPHRDRQECAYETGRAIVEMIHADRKPSDILTRESFINAIRVNSALGGSTNAPLHLTALARPVADKAGFLVLRGNLFDSAIMKTSVISREFRERYLADPNDPEAFEGRAVVFDGPEHYHARIDDPTLNIDERCVLFMRGAGPIGYPGAAEVVNMRAPVQLIAQGIHVLPCIGDGRQSGTSGSPSILNASPEAAIGGGLAVLRTGDRVRVDLRKGHVNALLS